MKINVRVYWSDDSVPRGVVVQSKKEKLPYLNNNVFDCFDDFINHFIDRFANKYSPLMHIDISSSERYLLLIVSKDKHYVWDIEEKEEDAIKRLIKTFVPKAKVKVKSYTGLSYQEIEKKENKKFRLKK